MRVSSTFIKPTFSNQVKSVYSGGARKSVPSMLGTTEKMILAEQLVHWLHPEIDCKTRTEEAKADLYERKLSSLTPALKELVDYFWNDHNNLPREQRNNLNSLPINIQAILENHKVN